jgi:hypothetical protein
VTAVTTAGLLAGLFGSAFVPAAYAADIPAPASTDAGVCVDDASVGYDGAAADGGNVTQYYAVAGKRLTFNYCSDGSVGAGYLPKQAVNQTVTVTVTGGTIHSYIPASEASAYVINAAGTSMTFLLAANDVSADELEAVKVVVTAASTVGTTVKVTYTYLPNEGTDMISLSRSVKTIAASRLKATLPVQTGGSTVTIDTAGNPAVATITENATTLNWSDTHNSSGTFVFVPKNDYGTGITGELVTISSSAPSVVNVHIAATSGGAVSSTSAAASFTVATTNGTGVKVGVYPEADASGTATLTLTVDGVVVWTKAYTVVGPVASITPVAGIKHVALAGALASPTSTVNLGSITAKDATGNAVTIASYTYFVDGFESAAVIDDATGGATAYAGFTDALCASTATAGSTRSIVAKSTYENVDGDDVTVASAAWTITCTGASGIITKIAFDKASYLPSSAVKIVATATDTGGRPLGYGATLINGFVTAAAGDEFTVTKQGTLTLADADSGTNGVQEGINFTNWVNGSAEWAATSHSATGDFGLVIAIADNDGGATGTKAESFTAVATVSNILASAVDGSLAVGSKKLKATATFGLGAAGKKIAFTLENARTGAVKTYYRKANASGVATFTLSFRGTFEVTAAWGDYMTDSLTLKK